MPPMWTTSYATFSASCVASQLLGQTGVTFRKPSRAEG